MWLFKKSFWQNYNEVFINTSNFRLVRNVKKPNSYKITQRSLYQYGILFFFESRNSAKYFSVFTNTLHNVGYFVISKICNSPKWRALFSRFPRRLSLKLYFLRTKFAKGIFPDLALYKRGFRVLTGPYVHLNFRNPGISSPGAGMI